MSFSCRAQRSLTVPRALATFLECSQGIPRTFASRAHAVKTLQGRAKQSTSSPDVYKSLHRQMSICAGRSAIIPRTISRAMEATQNWRDVSVGASELDRNGTDIELQPEVDRNRASKTKMKLVTPRRFPPRSLLSVDGLSS